jgi:hypothetical protein
MGDAQVVRLLRARGSDDAGTTQTLSESSLRTGNRWTFRDSFNVSIDATQDILVDNAGDRALRVVAANVFTDNPIGGSVVANADGVGSGTELPGRNDRINDAVATLPSGVTVEQGGTYSGGEASLPISTVGGTAAGVNATALTQLPRSEIRLDPGGSLLWSIENVASAALSLVFELVVARE